MYSKSDNREIMTNDEADEVIEELFNHSKKKKKKRYQTNLEKMEGIDFFLH